MKDQKNGIFTASTKGGTSVYAEGVRWGGVELSTS